jgi:hypothetical protein
VRLGLIQNNQIPSLYQLIPLQIEFEDICFILQIEVLAAHGLRQGGFPALARPDQGDGRVTLKVLM